MLQPLGESVKLSKDVHLREFERPLARHLLQLFLGFVEAALVFLVEPDTVVKFLDHLSGWLGPHSLSAAMSDV